MIVVNLKELWARKEQSLLTDEQLRLGKRLTALRVSQETGLSYPAVARMLKGEVTQFSAENLEVWCKYFDVEPGAPVPFITYQPNGDE